MLAQKNSRADVFIGRTPAHERELCEREANCERKSITAEYENLVQQYKRAVALKDRLNEKYVNVLDGGYKEYDIDFNGLKKLNKDTVGYVKVNATNINHVVVKGKDNENYKNNNFMKKKSRSGWIYMDSRNKLDGTDKHIVIYGSNNKEMFGSLDKVLTDKWQKKKEYHYITYVSENFENRYEVFSTYEADKADIKVDFNKQVDYDKYIKKIKSKSEYNYNVEVNSYDNILTLVSYDGNKQIVLHAKLIK